MDEALNASIVALDGDLRCVLVMFYSLVDGTSVASIGSLA